MPKNLSEALKAAKANRKVLSKLIIWESGVSKSQFYRIINGEEAPSLETKKKIAESLGIDENEFDVLQSRSKPGPETNNTLTGQKISGKKMKWRLPLLALAIALIGLIALKTNAPSGLNPSKTVTVPEDNTLFIKDVTIPDGSSVPVNTTFEKIWRVKNTGTVVWKNRYLKRMTPASSLICSSPAMVPIPETLPGQTIDIAVTFTTPHLPGSCRTDWKTSDENGNLYFPEMHGLYSIVTVVEN